MKVSIDIDPGIVGAFEAEASRRGATTGEVVRDALGEWVSLMTWRDAQARDGLAELAAGDVADADEVEEAFRRWSA